MMNARRPRIRPRSSLTPIAAMPAEDGAERTRSRRRPGRVGAALAGRSAVGPCARRRGVATGTASSRAVTWRNSSSRSLAAREKLTIGSPAPTAAASSRGGAGVVAAEAELDRAVVEAAAPTRRRVGARTRRGPPRGLVAEDADPEHRADAQPPLDVGDSALGEDLAAVDDGDARCTAPRARGGCGC